MNQWSRGSQQGCSNWISTQKRVTKNFALSPFYRRTHGGVFVWAGLQSGVEVPSANLLVAVRGEQAQRLLLRNGKGGSLDQSGTRAALKELRVCVLDCTQPRGGAHRLRARCLRCGPDRCGVSMVMTCVPTAHSVVRAAGRLWGLWWAQAITSLVLASLASLACTSYIRIVFTPPGNVMGSWRGCTFCLVLNPHSRG
jgi:hypothetical protein